MRKYLFLAIILLFLFLVSCQTTQSTDEPQCTKKIDCKDGRTFPAEAFNEKTGQCEPLYYTGGTPCFNEFQQQCEGDVCLNPQ